MKKFLLLSVFLTLLVSCSGRKQIEKALYSGNYDQAIAFALKKLNNNNNKDKNRKQDYVVMLEDAYYKAVDQNLNDISHLKKDGNPENYIAIYEMYLDLNARQEAIKPVLPLKIDGKTLNLKFSNYSLDMISARDDVAHDMYEKGLVLLESDNKSKIRDAYDAFKYIESIYPNYKDTQNLMQEAHSRGKNFVMVSVVNDTHQIIPQRLEDELLKFDTYELNQFWTVYHSVADTSIVYDYAMKLQLKRIHISADELHQRQLMKEKQIIDGWKYQLDRAGNVVKDSLGNDIKIDNIIHVRARYFEYNQFKSTQIFADVIYINLKDNQTLQSFPIDSEFVFENRYATIRGDEKALDRSEIALLNSKQLLFPSDAQMISDTGEDLKLQLKRLINSHHLKV